AFNCLHADVKALSAKFDCSYHAFASITSTSFVPSSYSVEPFVSADMSDHAAVLNVTLNGLEFIHDPKSGIFYESLWPELLPFQRTL
ncbi:hypothetical protein ACTXT7_016835, partial [Hymenolepis weldensis]